MSVRLVAIMTAAVRAGILWACVGIGVAIVVLVSGMSLPLSGDSASAFAEAGALLWPGYMGLMAVGSSFSWRDEGVFLMQLILVNAGIYGAVAFMVAFVVLFLDGVPRVPRTSRGVHVLTGIAIVVALVGWRLWVWG